jgi:hypothetical protein
MLLAKRSAFNLSAARYKRLAAEVRGAWDGLVAYPKLLSHVLQSYSALAKRGNSTQFRDIDTIFALLTTVKRRADEK